MKGQEFNRSTLLEILNTREAVVKFRKLNGDLRIMRCTLKEDLLPQAIQENLGKLNVNRLQHIENLVTVYDLDMDGWRSFHLDSIIEVL
jgi:hypothetical protein